MLKQLRIQNVKGWKEALRHVGIESRFLCREYVELKFSEKIGA
jgi:hypothetical protein